LQKDFIKPPPLFSDAPGLIADSSATMFFVVNQVNIRISGWRQLLMFLPRHRRGIFFVGNLFSRLAIDPDFD
jgi:hypothetical protein